MCLSDKKVFFADYTFLVSDNVYEPAEDSFLFAENLTVEEGSTVLDMGTGCGLLGVVAAIKAVKVVSVDINPYAVRCAKKNAKLNGVENKLHIVQADLFKSLRAEKIFDSVLFNAPYLPTEKGEDGSWLGLAWNGGINGRDVIDRFIDEVADYLKPTGNVFLMQSTRSDVDKTLRGFEEKGFEAFVVAQRALPFFEEVVLIEARIE